MSQFHLMTYPVLADSRSALLLLPAALQLLLTQLDAHLHQSFVGFGNLSHFTTFRDVEKTLWP